MRKIYVSLLSLLLFFTFSSTLNAQTVGTYVFTPSSGTYTSLSGATTSTATGDDGIQGGISLGFTFTYGGIAYTHAAITTNGYIRLGASAAITINTGPANYDNSTFPTSTNNPLIAGIWDDNNASGGSIVYLASGAAPNRTFSVEWINVHMGGGGSTGTPTATFKITLTETSNIATVEYGTVNAFTSSSASIGLKDATSFLSVTPGTPATASSVTANNAISSSANLTSGTTYTFSPPPPCVAPPGGGTTQSSVSSACAGVGFNLSVTGASFGTGLTYQWQFSLTGLPGSFSDILGATAATYTVPNQTAQTYYHRRITCSSQDAFSSDLLVGQNPVANCYCTVTFPSNVEPITLVQFATINNATSPTLNGTPALENFTSITANVNKGQSYPIVVKGNTDGGFTTYIDVYIDFNQDGDFTDAGENFFIGTIANSTGVDAVQASGNILIPVTALDGITRMRVTKKYNVSAPPCNSTGFGQAEDYLLNLSTPPCFGPTGLTVTTLTPTSATLVWTGSLSNPSGGYQWEVRTSGAGGSGAAGLVTSGSTAAGFTTANAGGLTANTAYSYYVRSNCGGIFSSWVGGFAFTTPCNPLPIPFNEGFTTYATTFPPTCWSVNNDFTIFGDPVLTAEAPSSFNIGLGSVRYEFYWTDPGVSADIVSALFTPVPAGYSLAFDHAYATYSGQVDQLEILYSTDGGTTYTNLVTYSGGSFGALNTAGTTTTELITPTAAQWATKVIALPVGTNKLMFRGLSDFGNNLFIDNIIVASCLPPTGLTVTSLAPTSVGLAWTASATTPSNGYQWEVRTSGAGGSGAAGLATSGVTTGTSTTASGLTANTAYTYYVRSDCGGSDFSIWAAFAFRTPCDPLALPFTEAFNSYATTFPPTCWTRNNAGLLTGQAASSFGTGTGSAKFDFWNAGTGTELDLTSTLLAPVPANYQLSFDHAYATFSGENDQLRILYSTNGGATYTSLITYDGATLNTGGAVGASFTPSAAQWATKKLVLPVGTNRLLFRGISAFGNNLYLDSITVKPIPLVDVGVSGAIIPNLNCPVSGVFIQAIVTNYNLLPINFATNPVTVTATITGAAAGSLPTVLNAGSLAAGASMTIYMPVFNFTTAGYYDITIATSSPDDPVASNNSYSTFVFVNATPATPVITPAAPQICIGTPVQLNTQFAPSPAPVNHPAVTSGALTIAIPDADAAGISHTLAVSGIPVNATVTGISVTLNATHTWNSDLIFNLKAPNGNRLNLVNRKGGNGDGFTACVISSASTNGLPGANTTPITGTFAADAAIGVGPTAFVSNVPFAGLYSIANGNWTLAINDNAGLDVGVLTSWSIAITYQIITPTITWTPVTGLYTNAGATTAYTSGSNAYSLYANPAATTTYTVTATTPAGCTSSATATVTVNTYPVITIGSIRDTVCISDPIVPLVASPVGGSWTGNGVSGTNFIPPATSIGTYTLTYSYANSAGCLTTATKKITVKECPERVILLRDNAVLLYPNPNNGQFNIRINSVLYNNLVMKVYTNDGLLVRTQQIGGLAWGRVVPIDLTNLPGGVYMVKFYYDGGVRTSEKTFKVIIAR